MRRGIVLRQRLDAHGRAIAVDAVGAGGLVPLRMASGGADDTNLVCRALCTLERDGLITRDAEGVRIEDRQRLEAV